MIHLICGEPAAATLRLAAPEGIVIGFPDDLSCGRAVTPGVSTLESWFAERSAFWLEVSGQATDSNSVSRLARSFREAAGAPEVTLWLGTGADDQLFAAWFATLIAGLEAGPTVHVIQFTTAAAASGRMFDVRSLTVLNASQLQGRPPPRILDEAGLAKLVELWRAWASESPEPLLRLSRDRDHSRWMSELLASLLDRYPLAGFGLNLWEHRVMQHIATHQPQLVRAIADTLVESSETADWIGDAWLFWRVRRLASPPPCVPLIALDRLTPRLRGRTATLTDAGAAVLAGRTNALDLNQIDDWVGGVHLRGADACWVRTAEGLTRYRR